MSTTTYYDLKQANDPVNSLSAQVARDVGMKILFSDYPAGDLVEDEAALAARYHVSRSVVRDAVKILVGKGLLDVRRGIGTRVRPRSSWGLLDDDLMAWQTEGPTKPETLRQLHELRKILEPKAAHWAAVRGTEERHRDIQVAIETMENEMGVGDRFILADGQFHRAILRATENEFMIALEGVIFSSLLSSIRMTNRGMVDATTSVPLHRSVFNAIVDRDGELAEQRMIELLSDTDDRLRGRLEESCEDIKSEQDI